ncbi:MAG: 5-oxoprolinase [Thermoprotei archaeon]|nr:MAG: 5-oxoprolinase [Thermoprotei archaeon]
MVDPITVEVVRCCLEYTAEEMGIALRNAAYSPNIKERMDHSCAIFDAEGRLLAQAEHIPVHLGSMAWAIKKILEHLRSRGAELQPNDVIAVNDPFLAGTHLNDIIMIKPVFNEGNVVAYVANRAHHVDVGGMVPGSISAHAVEVHQEGLIIPPIKIVEDGVFKDDVLRMWLRNVRAPEVVVGDIRAQVAACHVGEKRLRELMERYNVEQLLEIFNEILRHSEKLTRLSIKKLPDFNVEATDYLEAVEGEDVIIKVSMRKQEDEVFIDFTGSSPQVSAPLNAPMGITIAATSFVLKTILDPDLVINDGFYRPVHIIAPEGSVVNAKWPAAVGASIETAQRIVDVLYMALSKVIPKRVPAAACGSMNNILIGGVDPESGKAWVFYETVAGGYGGRHGLDGVDAVHCNMTNTMNTPIEVIEGELPLLFTRYEIRPGSGGAGKWRGGMGVIRSFRILAGRALVTIVGERVKRRPWGLCGGLPGEAAKYYVVRKDGSIVHLGSKGSVVVHEGDEVVVETAGGGGYGDPLERNPEAVLQDYLNGLIAAEDAVNIYGVVIKEQRIDYEETMKLRSKKRALSKS